MNIQKQHHFDLNTLIEEALHLGCNIHDYVALRLYGHVNDTTHEAAKDIIFRHFYSGKGSTPPTYKQYTIKIKGDDEYDARLYSVPAMSTQAARVLAFALYGGFGTFKKAKPVLQDDDIEMALAWTEVIN